MKHNWKYLSIGECFPSIKNGANIKQIAGANGYPITRIETLSGGIFNRDRMGYANIVDLTKYQDYILESGDLLLSHINSKAYIGRTVKYEKQGDEKIIHGMNLLLLRANPEVISSSLFAYYSKSMKFKDAVARIRKDAVNQSSMAISDLRKIVVPVPPLEEQSRIVAELDLLTGIIDKQNAQLKELDNLAQAIFYDMFGDPIKNEKGWCIKTLENIGKCISGGTPSRKNAEFFEGSINWYSAGELNSLYLEESIEKITETALNESAAKLCKANSLFIGMYDTAAFKLGITKTEAASNQACANVFPKEDNVIWLYFVLSIMRDEALKYRHGARQKNLNLGFIKSFSVPVPPLSFQQSFAEKIQSIEKQKETIRASIADTQKLLDYTMDKYFG